MKGKNVVRNDSINACNTLSEFAVLLFIAPQDLDALQFLNSTVLEQDR